jgi:hypothetical protein
VASRASASPVWSGSFAWTCGAAASSRRHSFDSLRSVLRAELQRVIDGLEEAHRVTALSDLSDVAQGVTRGFQDGAAAIHRVLWPLAGHCAVECWRRGRRYRSTAPVAHPCCSTARTARNRARPASSRRGSRRPGPGGQSRSRSRRGSRPRGGICSRAWMNPRSEATLAQHFLDAVPVQLVTRLERIAVDGFCHVLCPVAAASAASRWILREAGRRLKLSEKAIPSGPKACHRRSGATDIRSLCVYRKSVSTGRVGRDRRSYHTGGDRSESFQRPGRDGGAVTLPRGC